MSIVIDPLTIGSKPAIIPVMSFETVFVYNGDGQFLGTSIYQPGSQKLKTANLWTDSEEDQRDLAEQLQRLNANVDIRAYWPDVRDPEVQVLLEDEQWEPLSLSPAQVVDDEKSVIVWDEEPSDDNPFGRMNEELSVIVEKTVMAPSPVEVQARVKKACEVVARERAGLNG
jgi:hypothetical protein